MDEKYLKAEILFNEGRTQETIDVLNEILKSDRGDTDFLLLRAKAFYRLQKWGDALNDLNLILEINPDHKMAQNYKSMVMNIISFWNKDNFNP
jgi:tetratricopeptide (TPR) repeat protein